MKAAAANPQPRRRCAVYTRKSTEEGLDQDYNSIDAQRDAGHAYIVSQRAEGWIPVGADYDDPAFSGGHMERPALKRLLADIAADRIDIVVVYKIDRLTRSLTDFARMIEVFERHQVSFVSVTQQFNTTTSMGRLMLNVLLSFAQFEREVTGERIRDKIAASKRKGLWMGGVPPLGYDVVNRKLVVNEAEAMIVRRLFADFPRARSTTRLVQRLRQEGVTTKRWRAQSGTHRAGKLFDKGALYHVLNNPVYLGQIRHRGVGYPGEHVALVTPAQWEAVQTALTAQATRPRSGVPRSPRPALLKGLLFTADGRALTPHATTRPSGRTYRYYVSTRDAKEGHGAAGVKMLPAGEIEQAVLAQLRGLLRSPELVAEVWRALSRRPDAATAAMSETQVAVALGRIDVVWEQLFPAEQCRIVELLVERIVVTPNELQLRLRPNGIESLALDVVRDPDRPRSGPARDNEAVPA